MSKEQDERLEDDVQTIAWAVRDQTQKENVMACARHFIAKAREEQREKDAMILQRASVALKSRAKWSEENMPESANRDSMIEQLLDTASDRMCQAQAIRSGSRP